MSNDETLPAIVVLPPRSELTRVVDRLAIVEYSDESSDFHLPGMSSVLSIRLSGECLLTEARQIAPPIGLTGMHERIRGHAHERGNRVLLAHLRPAGMALLSRDASEYTNRTVDLADTDLRSVANRLYDRILESATDSEKLTLLQDFLMDRMEDAPHDPIVGHLTRRIEEGAPEKVKALADDMGLSVSALERRFTRQVGLPPVQLQKIARLTRALILRPQFPTLGALAAAAGYYDQSHFNRDFVAVTGRKPSEWFSSPSL